MRYLDLARLAVLAAAVVLVASSAQAFTLGSAGPANGDGSAIVDPDDQVKSFGGGAPALQEGGRSVQFGVSPSFGSGPTSSLIPRPGPSASPSWPAPGAFPDHQ